MFKPKNNRIKRPMCFLSVNFWKYWCKNLTSVQWDTYHAYYYLRFSLSKHILHYFFRLFKLYNLSRDINENYECLTLAMKPSVPVCLYPNKMDVHISYHIRKVRYVHVQVCVCACLSMCVCMLECVCLNAQVMSI